MKVTNAKYWKYPLTGKVTHIYCNIEGRAEEQQVPIDIENTDYKNIKEQVDAGTLTIEDAD
tara:strand:- start:63 stop:245 length:183 start_codon:yes stop_codon:yes gene_type:complete